ncbi:MAG: hypothetical protein WCQ72_06000 [Eubacteriales bacterium]
MPENESFYSKYQKYIYDLCGSHCRLLDLTKADFVKCGCQNGCTACGERICSGCGGRHG